MSLFGNKILADVLKFWLEMRLYRGGVSPKSSDRCPYKRQKRMQRDTEEEPWEDGGGGWRGAATGVQRLEPPEAGRGSKEPPLEPWEGVWPCDTLAVNLGPPEP